MKQTIVAFLLVSMLAIGATAGNRNPPPSVSGPKTPYAPGVVYVKLREGSGALRQYNHLGIVPQSAGVSNAFARILDQLHATSTLPFDADAPKDAITRDLGIDRMYVIYYSNRSIDSRQALDLLMGTGEVECGSVRYLFPLSLTPNDPQISSEYALTNMHLFKAWDVTIGDSNVLIADVDDGFNVSHEDLKNAIKIGWDLVGNVDPTVGEAFQPDGNPNPDNINSTHGSHTAGCIAATGANRLGIVGTAFGCRLMALKAAGNESQSNIDAGYEGIHYASTHGARVINCSWGGPVSGDQSFANTFLIEAEARNALIVASSGNGDAFGNGLNNDNTPFYPCNGPGVLSVGATDANDAPAGFSNYGHAVKVWAPGVSIQSCSYPGASAYNAESGTSFSSPLTAGVAGLLVSLHPDWPPQFIARQIIQTCQNVVYPSDRPDFWGRVNADSALRTSPAPGLIVTGYSLDGVANDSLRSIGVPHALTVTFKNVTAAGSGITAKLLNRTGYSTSSSAVTLGSVGLDASAQGTFLIIRNGIFSEGNLPVRFYLTDGVNYEDTVIMTLPLQRQPGFVVEKVAPSGASLKRVSHTSAWAAFGQEAQGGGVVYSDFARETAGVWSDTATLWNGSQAPYCVEATDSMRAWFGTGPQNGAAPSVILTTNGGTSFTQSDVSSFTAFVNTVHFFTPASGAPLNGIIIGDPASKTSIGPWGIGITSDGGQTWAQPPAVPNNLTAGEASWNNGTVWVGASGWFGSNSARIWRSGDRGATWASSATTLKNSLSLAMDDDCLHGFACFRNIASSSGSNNVNGMNKTTNGGRTWFTMAMPVAKMIPGAVTFVHNSNTAIVTSDSGVYRTTDFGTTWTPIGFPVGYDAANAESLSAFRGQGKLTLSMITSGTGVATYTEPMADPVQQGVSSEPAALTMDLAISPNPFQQEASVSFTLAERQHVRLAVIDALGREVALLLNAEAGPGIQSLNFNAGALPAGVYYVVIQTDRGMTQTRAISLLR